MPGKVVPVPGVPPHLWHKHQPGESKEDVKRQEINREDMAFPEENKYRGPGSSVPAKVQTVPLKQWQTTASDPARLRRLMPRAMAEPPRAAPKLEDTPDGPILYPHQMNMLAYRDPSREPQDSKSPLSSQRTPSPLPQSVMKTEPLMNGREHEPTTISHPEKKPTTSDQSEEEPVRGPQSEEEPVRGPQSEEEPVCGPQSEQPEPLNTQNLEKTWDKDQTFGSVKAYHSVEKDPEPVPPAPMRSPELMAIQIPRPNRNYEASVRSDLSELSLNGTDDVPRNAFREQSQLQHNDIRGKIAPKHELHVCGGKLINTDVWAGKVRRPDEIFLDPVYTNPWIEDYVENQIDYDVRATFLYEEDSIKHCHCDVNTLTGELMSPIQYEYTVPDYMNSEDLDRQMTRTASLYVKRKSIKAAKKNYNGPPRPPPGWVDTPLTTDISQNQCQPLHPVAARSIKSDPDPFSPRVECHLRPAREEDMEGVRAIYNWEVAHGLQALDAEPLSLADFHGVLKTAQDAKLPFVVAVSGAYRYGWVSSQENVKSSDQSEAGKVLAFGFLTIRQPGLAGSFSGTSRMTAKAHVFVHPEYRRKKIGHCCLDKLLSTVSTRYSTKLGYDFINIEDNATYKYPWQHDRKFYSVFIEYLVPRNREQANGQFLPNDTDLKWFERIMTSRYGFWKVGQLEATHRSRRSYEPAPIWLDSVLFEHICQEGLGFTTIL